MTKNLFIFGTRPEAIKMAPLIKAFQKYPELFDVKICVTAQHREMLDQVLNFFEITADYDLDLMRPDQNLYTLTANIITGMKPVLEAFQPDYVFVHGDTTTTMAGSIASFYSGAKVCHVEAGLRTHNKWSPFPEEIIALPMLQTSKEFELILDPFMGSGTTGIVCDQLGRRFVGYDLKGY